MIRVFLAGEGRSELGSRAGHEAHQSDTEDGVVQALLRAVQADGWEVVGSINWCHIRKLRVNTRRGDAHNVHAALLHAAEASADVLAFVRDNDRDEDRDETVERAVAEAALQHPVRVAGGVAVECVEGWLIAIAGEARSESVRHPEKKMKRLGLADKHAPDYAAHIAKHGVDRAPSDAHSLHRWLTRAREALRDASPPTPT